MHDSALRELDGITADSATQTLVLLDSSPSLRPCPRLATRSGSFHPVLLLGFLPVPSECTQGRTRHPKSFVQISPQTHRGGPDADLERSTEEHVKCYAGHLCISSPSSSHQPSDTTNGQEAARIAYIWRIAISLEQPDLDLELLFASRIVSIVLDSLQNSPPWTAIQ